MVLVRGRSCWALALYFLVTLVGGCQVRRVERIPKAKPESLESKLPANQENKFSGIIGLPQHQSWVKYEVAPDDADLSHARLNQFHVSVDILGNPTDDFFVYRKAVNDPSQFKLVGRISTSTPLWTAWIDRNIVPGETYFYQIKTKSGPGSDVVASFKIITPRDLIIDREYCINSDDAVPFEGYRLLLTENARIVTRNHSIDWRFNQIYARPGAAIKPGSEKCGTEPEGQAGNWVKITSDQAEGGLKLFPDYFQEKVGNLSVDGGGFRLNQPTRIRIAGPSDFKLEINFEDGPDNFTTDNHSQEYSDFFGIDSSPNSHRVRVRSPICFQVGGHLGQLAGAEFGNTQSMVGIYEDLIKPGNFFFLPGGCWSALEYALVYDYGRPLGKMALSLNTMFPVAYLPLKIFESDLAWPNPNGPTRFRKLSVEQLPSHLLAMGNLVQANFELYQALMDTPFTSLIAPSLESLDFLRLPSDKFFANPNQAEIARLLLARKAELVRFLADNNLSGIQFGLEPDTFLSRSPQSILIPSNIGQPPQQFVDDLLRGQQKFHSVGSIPLDNKTSHWDLSR